MRIGIIGLLHESNTFIGQPTTLEHFRQNILLTGDAIRERFADSHHELGGFFAGLENERATAVPIFAARAVPFGTIAADAFESLLDRMFAELESAGPVDGILVAPHGATVCESHPDADGHWLTELRKRVGRIPIIGTLDPHANLSPAMVRACHALISYRTNPHLDQRARGVEAAALMARTIRGEVDPAMAASLPPLAINIERQLTSDPQCAGLYGLAEQIRGQSDILSCSIMLGFPYADVAEMGAAAVVVADRSAERAANEVGRLGGYLWEHREDFVGQLISIDEALNQAHAASGPVCLLDMGDNVGGGSPADGTFLLHALRDRGVSASFVCLYDPEAVERLVSAGPGNRLTIDVGGKTDDQHGRPFSTELTVVGVYDGRFEEPEPRHGGFTHCDQGTTVVARTGDGITLMLTSRRMPPFSLRQLTSCQVDPAAFQVLAAKGVNAPVAAYQPVCSELIRVNTGGSTTADMVSLDFRNRRKPMFPFEKKTSWNAGVVLGYGG